MANLITTYNARIAEGELKSDPAQEASLVEMEQLRVQLETTPHKKSLLSGFFQKPVASPKGLYLWGGVGRGKSMLMDLFVDNLDIQAKRRVHFHAFMQEIHDGMARARKEGADDPLAPVAADIAKNIRLFAFDEMQITDITDAMLVGRLFEKLFKAGVVIITTSNRPPDDLYKNGLNRQLFVPFIKLLQQKMQVRELVSPNDYRQDRLAGEQVYLTPADGAAREAIDQMWHDLTGGEATPLTLTIKGRTLVLPAYRNGAARASFHDLCGAMLGPGDYLTIAQSVKLLVLEAIPRLGRSNFNEAKRFVTLIDALYEAKVRLIVSAAASPEMLYVEGEGSFEFERTASRLREMQDKNWGE